MSRIWKAVGVAGGLLGAAVAGTAVGAAAKSSQIKHRREGAALLDRYADEPLGVLKPDRTSTVAADDGVPIYVEEVNPADGGKPELTVVLVHGFALDRRTWHFQRRDLPQLTDPRVRLVIYDQRSHGRSGRGLPETSTIDQLGHDLDAVLRSMVPKGQMVLVGHSMGGMTIMALAEQRPELFRDRVAGVAFIGTSAGEIGRSGLPRPVLSRHNPVTLGIGRLASWSPGVVERVRGVGGQIVWSLIRRLAFGDRKVSPALVDLVDDMIATTSVQVLTEFLETLGTHNRVSALAGLRHTHVLVIGADADRLTPYSHSEVIAAELPDAELVLAEGAGHVLMLEQPALVNEHLAELFGRCVGRSGKRKRWWKRA
ncbi:alpha/beta fold hydrolase [Allokutzneria albata]|uniref:Pimeloyl-ACP methyl ester carboxylesterase n=1 Tax=Allokutzneria albata TaxID=211114 RepID=A0A1G9YYA7_ALLAB|nr:alpha/beta hydrolase [Allokutzneria albata]SDN13433.1 Pimeloyl-ACP methyl ester carboxylesterase [Allokutzneria albata]